MLNDNYTSTMKMCCWFTFVFAIVVAAVGLVYRLIQKEFNWMGYDKSCM